MIKMMKMIIQDTDYRNFMDKVNQQFVDDYVIRMYFYLHCMYEYDKEYYSIDLYKLLHKGTLTLILQKTEKRKISIELYNPTIYDVLKHTSNFYFYNVNQKADCKFLEGYTILDNVMTLQFT